MFAEPTATQLSRGAPGRRPHERDTYGCDSTHLMNYNIYITALVKNDVFPKSGVVDRDRQRRVQSVVSSARHAIPARLFGPVEGAVGRGDHGVDREV